VEEGERYLGCSLWRIEKTQDLLVRLLAAGCNLVIWFEASQEHDTVGGVGR
jgi:hypothetical protein